MLNLRKFTAGNNMANLVLFLLLGVIHVNAEVKQLIGGQQTITRNNLITTLDSLGKEFKVTLDFYGLSRGSWGMIVHFTIGGQDTSVYGDRIPCVYFNGNFEISFAVNGNGYYYQNIPTTGTHKWHAVEVGQRKEGNSYRYYIKINGVLKHSVINNDVRVFRNVKVYASDPWYTPQNGYIRNLYVDTAPDFFEPGEDGRLYYMSLNTKSWIDAKNECERDSSHLVIVDNLATRNYIKRVYGSRTLWIGATDIATEGKWLWVNGQSVGTSYWGSSEPNGGRNENCIHTNHGAPGSWNDVSCSASYPFLCQKGSPQPDAPAAPVVSCSASEDRIKFKCKISRGDHTSYVYEVTWFQSTLTGVLKDINTEELQKRNESYLQNTNDNTLYHLGVNIHCKVRTWNPSEPNTKSDYATSNTYFAGLKIDPPSIDLHEGGMPIKLAVTFTVPILCQDGSNNCKVSLELAQSNADVFFSPCLLVFDATTSVFVSQNATVVAKRDFVDNGQRSSKISPRLRHYNVSDDWENAAGPSVNVKIISVSTARCTSTGDPHIRTFDGTYFNHYRIGDYTLVKSNIHQFQVHVRTQRCARVSCNCGVVVREGDDVLSVNMCGNTFSPQARYGSKQEPQSGTYIEQSHNGKSFTLKFGTGSYVKFAARHWYGSTYYADITVQLTSDYYDNTVGLCGRIDNNRDNDMSDKDGKQYSNCGGQACTAFSESWKLSREESLFYYNKGNMTCLPASPVSEDGKSKDGCFIQQSVDTKVTNGYKKMVFPGQPKCDHERNVSTDNEEVIILTDEIIEEETDEFEGQDLEPFVPTFPTESGITEQQANDYCKTEIESSNLYKACKAAIGQLFTVAGFIQQCVADTQILDNQEVALQSAMDAMKSTCEEVVNRDPDTWETDDNGDRKPPTEVVNNICPNECSRNGNCSKGHCICNEGFVTDDCSVKTGQLPILREFPCGRICDIRKKDCTKLRVASQNLVPGNIACGFKDSMKRDNGRYIIQPSTLLSFSEVTCDSPTEYSLVLDQYPTTEDGIPIQTYFVSLSNDGRNFSDNALPIIVYDSKCMICENGTICKNPRKCVLKENTCMVSGFCFKEGEADPTNEKCRVCDPARSTSKFVYRNGGPSLIPNTFGCWKTCGNKGGRCPSVCGEGALCCRKGYDDCPSYIADVNPSGRHACVRITGSHPPDCKVRTFTIACHELYVTGTWEKYLFRSRKVNISLNDPSCHNFHSNMTHYWITANFKDCGSIIHERGNLMFQENTAFITESYFGNKIIERNTKYYYRMSCIFDRSINVSTVNHVITDDTGGNFNRSAVINFNASINIFASSSYLKLAEHPFTVTTYEPIYIGIKENYNNENFKFIVHQCLATPTSSIADIHYMFFAMKCPIDPTFKILSYSNNHFNFQIDAFTFIQVSKSIFIHCHLYVCQDNSTLPSCTQSCHIRKRRAVSGQSIIDKLPLEELSVRTDEITFEKKILCNEISCPPNSFCIEQYPAQCRCNEGYVFDIKRSTCNKDRTFNIHGLHVDLEYISTYSDTSSADFLKLATDAEKQFSTLFELDTNIIDGVKVIGASKGSVVLDLSVTYAKISSKEEAYNSFVKSVTANLSEVADIPTRNRMKIKTDIIPTIEILRIKEDNSILFVAIILPVFLVVIAGIVILTMKYKQSRKPVEKDIKGIQNEGLSMDKTSETYLTLS